MCTDLGPSIQEKAHARIVPSLMAAMDDFSNPRVQVSGHGKAQP
jgi:SpoVK/Ycf46/Vps4 family AAA+-type ATPase